MRKSFDGLSGLVMQHFKADLFSGHLFVFFNRKRTFVKILAWDQDGLSLWSKRHESGTFEKIASDDAGQLEIDAAELIMMLRGVQTHGYTREKRRPATRVAIQRRAYRNGRTTAEDDPITARRTRLVSSKILWSIFRTLRR